METHTNYLSLTPLEDGTVQLTPVRTGFGLQEPYGAFPTIEVALKTLGDHGLKAPVRLEGLEGQTPGRWEEQLRQSDNVLVTCTETQEKLLKGLVSRKHALHVRAI